MAHIAQDSLATIYFTFLWESTHAKHVERYLATDVSFTRDILPLGIKSQMLGLHEGDSVTIKMDPSEVPPFKPGKVLDMPAPRFQPPLIHGRTIRPRIGRYYPKNFIEDVPGTRPDSVTPFRVVETDKSGFKADMNHPMADREVTIKAKVIEIKEPSEDKGTLMRWSEISLKGPGMQARLPDTPTDYLGAEPFKREDESGDAEFYAKPRAEQQINEQARRNVQRLHAEVLSDGMDILDLMAGQDTRLPDDFAPKSVSGLGMHMAQLEANQALTTRTVHNLNEEATLPYGESSFDAVICTMGAAYLTKPFEVFEEVGRILRPGGVFVLSFTDRWIEEKAIRIWTEMLEFERMGLISQYFIRTELFESITTWSDRGWPDSDPVYAVWGVKK